MADAAVQITPGTGGIFVDTRTVAGGDNRQVVVVGDPTTDTGVAPVSATDGLSVKVTNAALTVGTHAVTQSGSWSVGVAASTNMVGHVGGVDYKGVGASATNTMLGTTGAAGDYLGGVLIIPGTTAAGAVSIKDGALSAFSVFAGGTTTALNSLIPFFVPLGVKSVDGGWQVTTGANVTAVGVGDFT